MKADTLADAIIRLINSSPRSPRKEQLVELITMLAPDAGPQMTAEEVKQRWMPGAHPGHPIMMPPIVPAPRRRKQRMGCILGQHPPQSVFLLDAVCGYPSSSLARVVQPVQWAIDNQSHVRICVNSNGYLQIERFGP